MDQPSYPNKSYFLYPRSRYCGQYKPEYVLFNAKLQQFSQQVAYVSALETGGKVSSQDAYEEIRQLWKQLKQSRRQLGIGQSPREAS